MKSMLNIENQPLSLEEVQEEINKQKLWRHRIPVGHDIVTPGRENNWVDIEILRFSDADGERVLDIGASDGFFSFYHEARGASEVIALDNFRSTPFCGNDTGIVIASRLRNSNVKLVNKSLYNLDPESDGMFDRILLLNVLYHLKHPIYALEKILSVCNPGAVLYLKSYIIDHRTKLDKWLNKPEKPGCEFYPENELNNDPSNWFGPNIACVAAWLKSAGFCEIKFLGKQADRAYFMARKMRD